jgi:UDPglucose 6-dehydrogenase
MATQQQQDDISVSVVVCIGAGYVGGPTMAVMARHCAECEFIVVDVNEKRIEEWNSDHLPIYEPGLHELIQQVRGRNLFFSTDVKGAIARADVVFVSVNTSTKEYGLDAGTAYDLTAVEVVSRTIASVEGGEKIVVEKSTVPVTTADRIQKVFEACGVEHRIEVLSNPEFLAEGQAIDNLENPDRVLIGCRSTEAGRRAEKRLAWLYRHWIPVDRIITTNIWSSELAKLAANAFLAQRISSINAISAICEKTGADVNEVAHVIGSDTRLGSKFLRAGVGFGGSCFRKDLLGLIYLCKSFQLDEVAEYWNQVLQMNDFQRERFVRNVLDSMFGTVCRKKIAVLGFAFKANTGDTRDSPAIGVVRRLLEERAEVHVYDPRVKHEHITELFPNAICHNDPYSPCLNAHAILVLTDWAEFEMLDFKRIHKEMQRPAFIFDGRAYLNHSYLKSLGFSVHSIGKGKL